MMKFCQPAATVPAPTSCPLMKRALGMTPQRSRMARTIPTKRRHFHEQTCSFMWSYWWKKRRVDGWTHLARRIRRWQIWLWGTWALVHMAGEGHLLRRRRGRERRERGWRRSCRWLWCIGILHLCCIETEKETFKTITFPWISWSFGSGTLFMFSVHLWLWAEWQRPGA